MKKADKEKLIKKEISTHGKTWCGATCQTFSPTAYRQMRIEGLSAKKVQRDYDLCHAFR